jgi:HPt (histidine-containing phosphotransfer) domain-containing protein
VLAKERMDREALKRERAKNERDAEADFLRERQAEREAKRIRGAAGIVDAEDGD